MAAIPQHQRIGGNAYLSYNSETGRYSFVYMNDSYQWMVDTYTPRMIQEGRMRFYRLRLTPQWYSGYTFATVADNATLVLYNVITNADVEDQVQNFPNNTTVGQEDVRYTNDPVEDDRRFREQRDGIHVVPPPPPQPPGGGAVAADGAESRQRSALPRLALAEAAVLAWPAFAAPEGAGAGAAAAAGAGDNSSALELLTALLENIRDRNEESDQTDAQNNLVRALERLATTTDRHPWDIDPGLLTPRNQPIRNIWNHENENTWPRRRLPLMGENGYGVYVPRYEEPAVLNIFNDNIIDIHYDNNRAQTRPSGPLKRVADTMLEAAIAKGETCPISLEPITKDSVCVAPCYHCFDKTSIQEWLGRNESCPTCRVPCAL